MDLGGALPIHAIFLILLGPFMLLSLQEGPGFDVVFTQGFVEGHLRLTLLSEPD